VWRKACAGDTIPTIRNLILLVDLSSNYSSFNQSWYGMRYDTVWDMIRYEIWYGMRYDMAWDMTWHEIWHGMRYDMAWDMTWHEILSDTGRQTIKMAVGIFNCVYFKSLEFLYYRTLCVKSYIHCISNMIVRIGASHLRHNCILIRTYAR
jgi:hypothetical protein